MPSQYFEVLLRLLERDPAVAALVGPRALTELPQDPVYPCILLRLPSRQTIQTLAGPTSCGTARPVVDCLSDDFTEAWQLEEAVRNALDGFRGTIDGCEIQHCLHVNSQDFPYDPDTGEELPLRSKRMLFDVFHSQSVSSRAPTDEEPAGPPTDPTDPTDPDPPVDPSAPIPDWPALTPSAEMVEQYGDSGPWDLGANGIATYATPLAYWFADSWWFWYAWAGDTPTSVTNATEGLPNGRALHQGTVDRVLAAKGEAAGKGFYTTLLRARTEASFNGAGVWPRTAAILTSDYETTWLDPDYNTPKDAYPEEQGIAYKIADCRDVHGREWARTVAAVKAIHPQHNRVFSDNCAMPQVAPTVDWSALCLLAGRGNYHQRNTFKVALPLVWNVTTRWHGDLRADLDLAAAQEIAGWHNEGLCHQHFMTVAQWNAGQPHGNQQYWMGLSWPGGGRRYFASNSRTDDLVGLNRKIPIDSVTPVGNTLDVVLTAPHRLANTSIQLAFPTDLHASLDNNTRQAIPHPSDPNRLTLQYSSAPPASGYGASASLVFPYSGMDVDAGWLHSIRTAESCCRATFVHGSGDARGYCSPIWRTWAAVRGYATGAPEKLSEHTVDGVACVKEIRTPFAGSWYLHLDFSLAERRAWWNLGS